MSRSGQDHERNRAVRRVLVVTMVLNLAVAAAKGVFGLAVGSLAIATDAVHSLVDAGANVIALIAIRLSQAPPDEGHPYGHRKFEIVAAAGIGVAVGIAAVRFAWGAIEELIEGGPPPETPAIGFGILIATWIVNIFVATYESRRGRELGSHLLQADAAHTASDVLVTAAVIGSYAAAYFGVAWADPVGALAVVAVIARVSWGVLSQNLSILVDQAVIDPDRIHGIASSVDGVLDCHRIRSRGTERAAQIDLHIQLDRHLSLAEAHEIAHQVEDALRRELSPSLDVTVHMEPDDDEPEAL